MTLTTHPRLALRLKKELHLCGNKMPTRCNRWFLYCRSYFLLNTFRAPLCPSSRAQEYYTGGCCLRYSVLWFSSCRSGVELWVLCPVWDYAHHQGLKSIIQVFVACGIWCFGFQVVGLVQSCWLCVWFAGCCSIPQTGHTTNSSTPDRQLQNQSTKYRRQQPIV